MDIRPIDELRASGRMTWAEDHRAWVAEPDEIVSALSHCGFNEYKREETRSGRGREPSGGVWQGIDVAGSVASAVWVNRPDASIVYIDIDGEPLSSEGASPPSDARRSLDARSSLPPPAQDGAGEARARSGTDGC